MHRPLIALSCLIAIAAACDSGPRYVGVGDVVAVDPAARQVTIRHDRIEGLMEAATTRFAAPADEVRAVLAPGARVRFELRRSGAELAVTKANTLAAGNPGIHDHTPHYGGIVAMAGMMHLEAKASPDGRVELYLTDIWRRPLPLDDVSGTVMLDLPDGRQALTLAVDGDALQASGPPLGRRAVNAAFALQRAGEAVEVTFLLPPGGGDAGAAGVPIAGCVAPVAGAAGARLPRCTLSFANPIATLAVAPDAVTLLVAQVDLGSSAWRLPTGEFLVGLAPPPPVAIPVAEPPHREAPNAVLVRPDGREVVVALENRLVRYAIDTGQVVRALDGPGGIVRAAAWSPDGSALLVSAFYNPAAALLDAADGHVRGRFPVEREGAAVAFAPDGRTVAVASEMGPVALFDVDAAVPRRVLRGARGPVRALTFTAVGLVAAGDDGVLRVWDAGSGALRLERRLGPTVLQMAVNAERGVVATAGTDPSIQLTALADGAAVETLGWHKAQILGLAWAGSTLISGDSTGQVALWPIGDASRAP